MVVVNWRYDHHALHDGATKMTSTTTLQTVLAGMASAADRVRLHLLCVHGDPASLALPDSHAFTAHHHEHAGENTAVRHSPAALTWDEGSALDSLAELAGDDLVVRDQLTTVLDATLERLDAARQLALQVTT